MAEVDEEQLVAELRSLGRAVAPPETDAGRMAAAVVAALPARPEPRLSRRTLALVALAVLVALVATPPVRAAVADWLGFSGVRVELGDAGGDALPPPAIEGGSDVEEAARQVSFPVLAPAALGRPTGVEVAPDGRMVSMTWTDDGSVVRLDQFDGTLDFAMAKRSPEVQYAAVGPVDALWFDEPHEVVLLAPNGSRRVETARLAGHTLIWPRSTTTLRLEGDLDLEEAVAIAESARPVG
ncbi:MAG TPA: hypothetical protein VFG72_07245 [Marmoricola sp.]|nr:hypothetical protein [Marmoricola sp.]